MAGDIVETKVGGKVIRKEVPAGATQEQIRAAFRAEMRKHGINVADQAVIDAPKPKLGNVLKAAAQPTLSAYNPGWSEKAQQKISDLLMGLGMDRIGALNLGKNLTSFLNDWTPVGNVTGVADADNDLERQLSMLPLPGPARNAIGQALRGIKAFHGSPHDFDKFSLDKIGTGEGAQAYGHGLYFAENPAVAQQYQMNLGGIEFATGSPDLDRSLNETIKQIAGQSTMAVSPRDAVDVVGERLMRQRSDALKAGDLDWFNRVEDQRRALEQVMKNPPKPGGRMYEVNINADPDSLLDWDAPLAQQSEQVLDQIGSIGNSPRDIQAAMEIWKQPGPTRGGRTMDDYNQRELQRLQAELDRTNSMKGADFYQRLAQTPNMMAGKHVQAAEELKRAGLPGIKYLDQGSRTAGQGSRNFVVFDDSLVDILRKY